MLVGSEMVVIDTKVRSAFCFGFCDAWSGELEIERSMIQRLVL